MSRLSITPTGKEQFFGEEEIIVSKTDLRGRITYVNEVFLQISGFREDELLGQPHSMIRHPEMPRAVFKLLWDTISSGQEIFAYVKNMCKNGDHYWVYAHVTPTLGNSGEILGYHSSRRTPDRRAVETVEMIYSKLLEEERKPHDSRKGLDASTSLLTAMLEQKGQSYSEFIWGVA